MKSLFIGILLITSSNLFAAEYSTKIHEILSPVAADDSYLILGEDGNIYSIDSNDLENLENANLALENNDEIIINTKLSLLKSLSDKREEVKTIEFVAGKSEMKNSNLFQQNIPTPLDNYSVTELDNEEIGKELFNTMNRNTKRHSQCYNRAHVWSYELSKKSVSGQKLKLGKTWIFFTRKYIREYKYKWWFHIAPFIKYKNSNDVFVMDRSYTKLPTALQEWSNIFMKNNSVCKIVEYYSDYRDNQESQSCFIILSSMYYWQPFNIEKLENGEKQKLQYENNELEQAYKNAIKRWDGDIN